MAYGEWERPTMTIEGCFDTCSDVVPEVSLLVKCQCMSLTKHTTSAMGVTYATAHASTRTRTSPSPGRRTRSCRSTIALGGPGSGSTMALMVGGTSGRGNVVLAVAAAVVLAFRVVLAAAGGRPPWFR